MHLCLLISDTESVYIYEKKRKKTMKKETSVCCCVGMTVDEGGMSARTAGFSLERDVDGGVYMYAYGLSSSWNLEEKSLADDMVGLWMMIVIRENRKIRDLKEEKEDIRHEMRNNEKKIDSLGRLWARKTNATTDELQSGPSVRKSVPSGAARSGASVLRCLRW